MPAIKLAKRCTLDPLIDAVCLQVSTPGEVVYVITRLLLSQYAEASFVIRSRALADLEATKLEWYRMMLAGYEDSKYLANGPVFPCL